MEARRGERREVGDWEASRSGAELEAIGGRRGRVALECSTRRSEASESGGVSTDGRCGRVNGRTGKPYGCVSSEREGQNAEQTGVIELVLEFNSGVRA